MESSSHQPHITHNTINNNCILCVLQIGINMVVGAGQISAAHVSTGGRTEATTMGAPWAHAVHQGTGVARSGACEAQNQG